MFWRIECESCEPAVEVKHTDGRFVVHRHCDENGVHLDLRLEQDGYLLGWRIDGDRLEGGPWAVEKPPHPLRWLDQDGDAVREDWGVYTWEQCGARTRSLVLHGRHGARRLNAERVTSFGASMARDVAAALTTGRAEIAEAGRLIADGVTARRRAIERLCGLGRELDGEAFDGPLWRKSLALLSLDDIHGQLRAFEARFDKKYPPAPASRPERLPEAATEDRRDAAMSIAAEW